MTCCREVSSWIDTLVDGELPIERAVDAESHIAQCSGCAERLRFERAFRGSLKQSLQIDRVASGALRERLERALVAERLSARVYACTPAEGVNHAITTRNHPKETHGRALTQSRRKGVKPVALPTDVASSNWGPLSWRSLLPVAAAAAGAILWAGVQNQSHVPASQASVTDLRLSELDSYLDSMVSRHRDASAQPRSIQFSHEEWLDPPFQLPPFQDVRSIGGRSYPIAMAASSASLSALRGASSAYQVKGHRVTFFAYETGTAPLRARLEGRSLRGHVVYVGKRQGYSVATVEEGPVGYAMTSDLPPMEGAELIAAAIDARVRH